MDRRAALATLTGTIVTGLFVAVTTAGSVKFTDGSVPSGTSSVVGPVITIPPTPVVSLVEEQPPWELPWFVEMILRVVFLACVAIVACLVVRYAWRHRPRLHWTPRRRPLPPDFDVPDMLDEVATAITADAEAQHSALRRGSARNAIVDCWLRLEDAVIAAGVPREPADTSTELTQRILTTLRIDPTAIADLAALYREARFSSHAMTEGARRDAIAALDAVHEGLRPAVGTAVATV